MKRGFLVPPEGSKKKKKKKKRNIRQLPLVLTSPWRTSYHHGWGTVSDFHFPANIEMSAELHVRIISLQFKNDSILPIDSITFEALQLSEPEICLIFKSNIIPYFHVFSQVRNLAWGTCEYLVHQVTCKMHTCSTYISTVARVGMFKVPGMEYTLLRGIVSWQCFQS